MEVQTHLLSPYFLVSTEKADSGRLRLFFNMRKVFFFDCQLRLSANQIWREVRETRRVRFWCRPMEGRAIWMRLKEIHFVLWRAWIGHFAT